MSASFNLTKDVHAESIAWFFLISSLVVVSYHTTLKDLIRMDGSKFGRKSFMPTIQLNDYQYHTVELLCIKLQHGQRR